MTESVEALHDILNEIDRTQPNYVLVLYVLGVLYTHLKNEQKAKISFQAGAKQITSIKEVGQSG